MEKVQINKVYRHFKGNYYFVENVGYDCENVERLVIYKALYSDSKTWIRPEKNFLGEIDSNKEGNITKQTHRFELATDISKDYRA